MHIRTTLFISVSLLISVLAAHAHPDAPFVQTNIPVKMRDGVTLSADVWLPAAEGKFPVLVYRTPYSKSSTSDGALVRKAVARGYAVVVQDVRGRYASGGEYDAYRQEGKDG